MVHISDLSNFLNVTFFLCCVNVKHRSESFGYHFILPKVKNIYCRKDVSCDRNHRIYFVTQHIPFPYISFLNAMQTDPHILSWLCILNIQIFAVHDELYLAVQEVRANNKFVSDSNSSLLNLTTSKLVSLVCLLLVKDWNSQSSCLVSSRQLNSIKSFN